MKHNLTKNFEAICHFFVDIVLFLLTLVTVAHKIILTWENFQKLFNTIIARESVGGVLQSILSVNLDSLDHEGDVIRSPVHVEI